MVETTVQTMVVLELDEGEEVRATNMELKMDSGLRMVMEILVVVVVMQRTLLEVATQLAKQDHVFVLSTGAVFSCSH